MRSRRSLPTVLLGILLGCSSDLPDENGDGVADGVFEPNNVSVITPSRPKGHVAGEVLDATTGLPLKGAKVRLFGGGLSGEVTTDASGTFQFGPIAAGARFSLKFSAANHTSALLSGLIIEDAAGNFPTDNGALYVGPIGLLPTRGQLTVQVVSEEGAAVAGARVMVESAIAYLLEGRVRGTVLRAGKTEMNGQVTITGLPDVWALPPGYANNAALVIHVPPVDLNGDGKFDLRGGTRALTGTEVREATVPPIVVLNRPGANTPLTVVASNVAALAGVPRSSEPAVLGPADAIRVVFNLPVDPTKMVVDLRDEAGMNVVVATVEAGQLPNLINIKHDAPFREGQEYNLSFRAQSAATVPATVLQRAAPFFVERDPMVTPVRVRGRFVDANMDSLWGNVNDRLEIVLTVPVGRASQNPAFRAYLFVDLDLDASGTIGDGRGELPPPTMPMYPPPITIAASEPSPRNNAGLSGYTGRLAPYGLVVMMPLTQLQGPVAFELQLDPLANGGTFVTDAAGRMAPLKIEGSAQLVGP